MQIKEKQIPGVLEIQLNPIGDSRGYFMRVFDQKILGEAGLTTPWVQENQSLSKEKYTLRGLHFQLPPFAESKLIRVLRGSIMDVFVDLRTGSQTFGKWGSANISEQKRNMLYIPRGFAHGFLTLEEDTEVCYKVDNYYSPDHESGILWSDPTLNIQWGCENPVLSEKDNNQPSFSQFKSTLKSITV